jgi:hypothetical protein
VTPPARGNNDGSHIVAGLKMGIHVHWAVENVLPHSVDGGLHMEAALEQSTITTKPGVETLARTAISPRGGSRAHKTA